MSREVFVAGGTGYVGARLIPDLLGRGHRVHALVRPGSVGRVPPGSDQVVGNALDGGTYAGAVPHGATFVHLVGVPHPSPAKAPLFRTVDLASTREALVAALRAEAEHFVYVSVARPAPVMREYQRVRAEAEALIADSRLPATVLRPWYVLGPGHRWPHILRPLYALAELIPSTRAGARRLGLVTLRQMAAALVAAVEHPPDSRIRVVDVQGIRAALQGPGAP